MKHVILPFSSWLNFRTANSAVAEISDLEFAAFSTPNALPDNLVDGWFLVAPFGEFKEPNGTYIQVFGPEQSENMIRSWNSITGRAFRWMKNARHRIKPTLTLPIFEAPPLGPHPDLNPLDYSKLRVLGEVSDLRSGNSGLEAFVKWSPSARSGQREPGPLYPSGNWWHEKPDAAGKVYPEHLESITLTRTPNIRSVPAWTPNSAQNLDSQESLEGVTDPNQNKTANNMDKKKIIEMLGLGADATDEQIETALKGAGTTANALTTASAAKVDLEARFAAETAKLTTANTTISTLTVERDQLKTANSGLTTANEALVKGVLDLAEKRGAITPAERTGFQDRIATANTAGAALAELQTRKAMNVQAVEINGNRIDLSTANSRADALEAAIAKRMKDENLTRDQAFGKCQADPTLAVLFSAMSDPTRKS